MVLFTDALSTLASRERQRPYASKLGESYGHTVTFTSSFKLGLVNTTVGLSQDQALHFECHISESFMTFIASVFVYFVYFWKALVRVYMCVCLLLLLSDPFSSFLFVCMRKQFLFLVYGGELI